MKRPMKYAVVIEKTERNFSAHIPDLPGCVATGPSAAKVGRLIREAVQLHIKGLREDGLPVPKPTARCEYIEA
ncbi:MAG TPA: type II toxin-antitoxin system HicB family antitoxin [Candidatus Binataceae bacterium]|nr:type II toxin-antitoxin system HicB family antitoxin [Candidatus Binataceae bacterium]